MKVLALDILKVLFLYSRSLITFIIDLMTWVLDSILEELVNNVRLLYGNGVSEDLLKRFSFSYFMSLPSLVLVVQSSLSCQRALWLLEPILR